MEQAALERLALPGETSLPVPSFGSVPVPPVPSFGSMPVPPAFSFRSLGYGVVRPSRLVS